MSAVVYTAPHCQPCKATIKRMTDRGILFSTIDISSNAEAANHARSLGFSSAPVIVTLDGRSWTGFRPDLIDTL